MLTIEFFGFEFKRKTQLETESMSISPPPNNDGAVVVQAGGGVTGYAVALDLDGTVRTEAELVTRYRNMSQNPECDMAIDEVVNEAMDVQGDDLVMINMDKCKDLGLADPVKRAIEAEFQRCLELLDFSNLGLDTFRRWYVDGRINFDVVIDKNNPSEGVQDLRYIDPRKIRKIREVKRQATGKRQGQKLVTVQKVVSEYYIYNEKGFGAQPAPTTTENSASSGIKIARDRIIQVTSGLTDVNGTMVLSHLHKAIKPLNQLRTLEDAAVIYRLSRAPERRVWYIDVGNLPKIKAEQYLKDIMTKHKNRLVYDASNGDVRDDRKFMTMLEDFWLPRREGGQGTKVETLPGGQNLGQMDDVLYFQKKLYRALNVPTTRLDSESSFTLGRATEITRDEVKFGKFITRLRTKFSELFLEFLERQIILKNIMTYDEWIQIRPHIRFEFSKDNYFSEMKESEILRGRLELLELIDPFVGKYFNMTWIKKNVLKQTDDDIEEMEETMPDDLKTLMQFAKLQQMLMATSGLAPDGTPLPPTGEEK